jgi:hypothetical protein
MTVDHGIDTEGEDMLMMDGEDSWVDDGAEGDANLIEFVVDGRSGENASGTDFVDDFASLVEHEGKDVFVIADGNDALQDQFAVASDSSAASAIVGMLPRDASILLMNADTVLKRNGNTFIIVDDSVEVLDMTKAVTAKFEIVCHCSCPGITKIEGGLLVVRRARVGIRNVHIREGKAVEEWPGVVPNIIKDHAFSLIVANSERPFLPFEYMSSLSDRRELERCSLGLDDLQRLEICAEFLVLGNVFIRRLGLIGSRLLDGVVGASREAFYSNDLEVAGLDDG